MNLAPTGQAAHFELGHPCPTPAGKRSDIEPTRGGSFDRTPAPRVYQGWQFLRGGIDGLGEEDAREEACDGWVLCSR